MAEYLEEWDWETGKPTGRSIERNLAHQKGVPHEGVHLWVIRERNDRVELLFQKRSPHKDQYPGFLDITVGGHVPFGLEDNKIEKEAFEEIGLTLSSEQLFDLGYIRYEEEISDEFFHREFQHLYLLVDNRDLGEYRFNDGEVTAICAVDFNEFKKLFSNNNLIIESEYFDNSGICKKMVKKDDFHPLFFSTSMKKYLEKLFDQIQSVTNLN